MSDQTPETQITTQAQLLRAAADLLERHAPELAPSKAERIYISGYSKGWSKNRSRRLLAELRDAGLEVVQDEAAGGYFEATFEVGDCQVIFCFDRYDVAEKQTALVERETWVLVPEEPEPPFEADDDEEDEDEGAEDDDSAEADQ